MTSYLFVTTSPMIRVFILLGRGKGPKAVLSVLVNETPTLVASVILDFTWREEKSVLGVRRQV
jgi:hypothetical protein